MRLGRRKAEEELVRAFMLKELRPVKKAIALKIKEQRKVLEQERDLEVVLIAQAKLQAYREILHLGKKARGFFKNLDTRNS